jgi:hypothetical protein
MAKKGRRTMADVTVSETPEVETAKGPTATGNTVKVGDIVELNEYTDTLDFTIPKDNLKDEYKDKAGEKIKDVPFAFPQAESDEQASEVCIAKGKGWTLKDFVNDALKATARSAAYQRLTAQYKESDMSPDEARLRLIRAFQRQGVPEDLATRMVDETLRNKG